MYLFTLRDSTPFSDEDSVIVVLLYCCCYRFCQARQLAFCQPLTVGFPPPRPLPHYQCYGFPHGKIVYRRVGTVGTEAPQGVLKALAKEPYTGNNFLVIQLSNTEASAISAM